MIGHILDLVILVLLVGALGFGLVIDRRVRRLMAALAALEPAVTQFSSAVDRSAETVTSMKSAAQTPESAGARHGSSDPALRRARGKASGTGDGTARVEGKSDLVRSFFETVRDRST